MKKFLHHLDIRSQCNELGVGLWMCPQFLFVITGAIVILVVVTAFNIAGEYTDATGMIILVTSLTIFLLVIGYVIILALEQVVVARQREKAQTQALLKLKDQFVFVAAHELRTPATAIRWVLESYKKRHKALSPEEEEMVTVLTNGSDRLLKLVQDLLRVSRIETNVVSVEVADVSLLSAVVEIQQSLEGLAKKHRVTVQNEIKTGIPLIQADPTRLKEVIDNLLSNAIKYSKEGGVVRFDVDVADAMVTLHVKDGGIGIKKEDVPHVFQKFWRAKEVSGVDGTGLGLFIAKELMRLMRGTLTFTSQYGEGTTFSASFRTAGIGSVTR